MTISASFKVNDSWKIYMTKCSFRNTECQIISTGSNFWSGDYAIVLIDGKFEKVSQSRLYDIREE